MTYHYHMRGLTATAALVTGLGLMAAVPATASTMTINFESGYTDNEELSDGDTLLDSAGNPTSVSILTPDGNTMSVEASGDSSNNPSDKTPDGFVNDPLGDGFNDTESAGASSSLGDFFLRNTEALSFDAGAVNPVFSLVFGGDLVTSVSAEIWDIDGNDVQGTEQWMVKAFDSSGTEIESITSPQGTRIDNTSLNGLPWEFAFSDIGTISRIDFDFTGTKTQGIGVAFDNLTVSQVPLPASALLLLGGLGGLGGLSALRRRKHTA